VQKEVCSDLLPRYEPDGESFLSWIVTGDETWIHHFELETNRQSIWNGIIQLLLKGRSLRLPLQQGKSWPVFWDAEGAIFVDIMPCGQTINSDLDIQTLKNLQKHLRRV
jgi:hypothetical protein